ncbi:MAG: glycoside hydrolase family 3 C-terminal domain-containing protein [Opitutae bacterium]|nr:glycoside hydrolase family 3 C-terminal domain-containing protein [Opitutae bacterium]
MSRSPALLCSLLLASVLNAAPLPYQDHTAPVEARVADLLGRLTLDEKFSLITGDREFYIRPIPRLGLPEIVMADGPLGVRNYGQSTAYPATIAVAASWDTALAESFGAAMGRDCRARGVHILLAPGVNIQRVPTNGRNFEYFSEDPLLAARMGVGVIRGLQGQGVVATVKHYAGNNQETERGTINVRVGLRALRELYLPAFRAAVTEGHVWAVMNSYNRLNGPYATTNDWLNNVVLKREWGFPGVLMSDWGAVHDTAAPFNGGLDLEMPGGEFFTAERLRPLLALSQIDTVTLDDKVSRILRLEIANGFLDRPQKDDSIPLDDPRSAAAALQAAREGIVLLKNEHALLPLDRAKPQRIVVLGPLADLYASGGGSSHVRPFHSVSALEGLRALAGPKVEIDYIPDLGLATTNRLLYATKFATPLKLEFFNNVKLAGEPVATQQADQINYDWTSAPVPALGDKNYSARWTGEIEAPTTGEYSFVLQSDDGSRLYLDDEPVIDLWGPHAVETKTKQLNLQAGTKHRLRVEYFQSAGDAIIRFGWGPTPKEDALPARYVERVRTADAVVVCAGFLMAEESEGFDHDFALPNGQPELLRAVAAVNPRTIAVLHTGNRVATADWIGGVPALLQAWFPGQAGGQALAEILFGDTNPSAKLPVTYEARWEDNASFGNFPGKDGHVDYVEDIFVGYRWFDHKNLAPLFPFGHGLSYTTFKYDDVRVASAANGGASVTFRLTNTGSRPGTEVAQVYIEAPPGNVPRAVRELKGFARVTLAPGGSQSVTVPLGHDAFTYFDEKSGAWQTTPGRHVIAVGASSRDLRGSAPLDLP